jgi:hypothetical protein
MGDSMFGSFGYTDISQQVRQRNTELRQKRQELQEDIDKKEAIIQRSDRDFSDTRATLPEKLPTRVLHTIEDYTLALFVISYLFMICACIYIYTITSSIMIIGFGKALFTSIAVSCVGYMLMYYIT